MSAEPKTSRTDSDRASTGPPPSGELRLLLLDEMTCRPETAAPSNSNLAGADTPGTVTIAVVTDPARLLRERGLGFNGDVVDLLTDLALGVMEETGGGQEE